MRRSFHLYTAANYDTQLLNHRLLEQFELARLPEVKIPELDVVVSSLLQVFPEVPDEVNPVREHPYTGYLFKNDCRLGDECLPR